MLSLSNTNFRIAVLKLKSVFIGQELILTSELSFCLSLSSYYIRSSHGLISIRSFCTLHLRDKLAETLKIRTLCMVSKLQMYGCFPPRPSTPSPAWRLEEKGVILLIFTYTIHATLLLKAVRGKIPWLVFLRCFLIAPKNNKGDVILFLRSKGVKQDTYTYSTQNVCRQHINFTDEKEEKDISLNLK
jgi:hypothetical protein